MSDSKSLVIYLTNLLKENSSKILLNELIQVNKFETDLARPIVFLIDLLKLDLVNVFELYKKKIVSKLDENTILEWLSINGKENEEKLAFILFGRKPDPRHHQARVLYIPEP